MIPKIKRFVNLKNKLLKGINRFKASKIFKASKKAKLPSKKAAWLVLGATGCFCLLGFALPKFYYEDYFSKTNNGSAEAVQLITALPQAEKLIIWSNNRNFCQLIKSRCYSGNDFPNYTEFDYFVFFNNQDNDFIAENGNFSELEKYAFKKIELKTNKEVLTKVALVKNSAVPPELLPAPAEFTFAIIGDSQKWTTYSSAYPQNAFNLILKNIQKFKPAFLLAMGDLTADFHCKTPEICKKYYEKWKNEVEKYVPVVYPAMGNHDESNFGRTFFRDTFSLPQNGPDQTDALAYSFDFENSHFAFFDSEKSYQQQASTNQLNWLKNDLENNFKRNTFLISHAGNFPNAKEPTSQRPFLWELIFKNNLFAQFSGHAHVFCQRTINAEKIGMNGLTTGETNHFIIGNAGSMNHPIPDDCEKKFRGPHFAIVKIKGSAMILTVYDAKGVQIIETDLENKSYFKE